MGLGLHSSLSSMRYRLTPAVPSLTVDWTPQAVQRRIVFPRGAPVIGPHE